MKQSRILLGSVTAFLMAMGGFLAADEDAQQCRLELSAGQSVLPADKTMTTCVKVGITGFEMESEAKRPGLNVSLVIDKSGSMSGEKIEQAIDAACCAVNQMNSDDILSVIAYSSDVEILVPATKLSNKSDVLGKIRAIEAEGTTALYDGTVKGGEEVKKFFDKGRVNRVILLSDGQANVGPSSADELGKLGQTLGGEGITVTTFGLGEGFNEDLMQKLAQTSDGNHVFITSAKNIVEVFDQEFKTATKAVASEVACKLICADGVRPVRVLNRDAEINGQNVLVNWNQIYSGHQRFVMVELEVPAGENGEKRSIATAELTYANMKTNVTDKLSASLEVSFSNSESVVKESENKEVQKEYVLQNVALNRNEAIRLRDQGNAPGAAKLMNGSADLLRGFGLVEEASRAEQEAVEIGDDASWSSNRKVMRAGAAGTMNQQLSAPVK